MYSPEVEHLAYDWTHQASDTIVDRLSALRQAIANHQKPYRFAISSWKTGSHAKFSSMIAATKCALGVDLDELWEDTLKHPAIPNAKTRSDTFNTSQHTPTEKDAALKELPRRIAELRDHLCGWIDMDSSELIYEKHTGYSVHDEIE